MDVLTYDELRVIEREERSSNKLTVISEDFIQRFHDYVADKQRVLDKSDDNLIAAKVKERTSKELFNARNSFKSIFEYRSHKIFNQVLLDLRMGVKPDFSELTSFEKKLYEGIKNVLQDFFNSISKGKLKKGVSSTPIKDNNLLVRFVSDLPEFVWGESSLGPFARDDVANLPVEVVKLLLNKKVVKVVLNEND